MNALRDLRQAARSLARARGFAIISVLTLGLGLGATTAIFSVVERVLVAPLPYPEAERLVRLTSETTEGTWDLSRAQYSLFGEQSRTIDRLAGFSFGQTTLQGPDGPERVGVWRGTAALFQLLGARPVAGRLVDEADDDYGAPLVAILSHGYWQRAFGGDGSVVGRTLMVNDAPVEIVGVMQRDLELPAHVPAEARPDIWLPLQLNLAGQFINSHNEFQTLARLAPGSSAEEASVELAGFNPRLTSMFPQAYYEGFMERYGFRTRATPLKDHLVSEVAGSLWILLAGVGLVLLIACANIANLLLARAEGRRREMAVRTAMGAGRAAIIRSFLAESLVVAAAGALLGLLLAYWGTEWVRAASPGNLPRLEGLSLDGSTLAFTGALTVVVALALSILPGLRYARGARSLADLMDGGRTATVGRERQRARGALVMTQVALAMVLLVGSALLIESFRRIRAVDPGIDVAGVVAVGIPLPWSRYQTRQDQWSFYDAMLERVRAIPGVVAAGTGQAVPIADSYGCTIQAFPDAEVMQRIADSNNTLCATQVSVTDGYFEALGIRLLEGRTFERADNDHPETGTIVVSQAFVRKFWPSGDALGRRVAPGGRTEGPFYTVVGVVGDVYGGSPTDPPAIAIYYPVVPIPPTGGLWGSAGNLIVRTASADPMTLFPEIREAVQGLDPAIPLDNPRAMTSVVAASVSGLSFTMTLLGLAAFAALVLAAVGLYGVLSYLVQRRTGEIGVRMAMGAPPGRVERMVVGGSLRIAVAGLVVGGLAALALTRFLGGMLYQVQPTHPAAYVAAAGVLAGVVVLASWVPARRAAGVDPVVALRAE
ncbi:MAG TPA: ABC transporter permease [Gemmatimonadota bacterium]|nr:ABC transporter permease [Gemmatimonadota bacterium]